MQLLAFAWLMRWNILYRPRNDVVWYTVEREKGFLQTSLSASLCVYTGTGFWKIDAAAGDGVCVSVCVCMCVNGKVVFVERGRRK